MAPRTDRTTRIPSGVASPATAKGSVFVKLSKRCRQLKQMAGLRKDPCLNGSEVVAVFQAKGRLNSAVGGDSKTLSVFEGTTLVYYGLKPRLKRLS
jgi:hypothetical protein